MTNWDAWQLYMEDVASPQNYIDWAFIFLQSAALQRRVWCPPEHRRLYPNIYVTIVGKPGIGKGQVIRPMAEILKSFTQENLEKPKCKTPEEQVIADAMYNATMKQVEEDLKNNKDDENLILPCGADAVTYEALVQQMTRSIRRINCSRYDETQKRELPWIYSHSSLAFYPEEIASLFRKNTESLVNFLIQAYDCGENYEYVTKTQGKDRIRKLCLNFFGGTNPDFMQDTFDDKLLSQGYSSRTFYIYAARNRKSVMFLPELTDLQKIAKKQIIDHTKKLTQLYGQVKIDKSLMDWLQSWWVEFESNPSMRKSKSDKLDAYYARRNIHTMKIAMAKHFSESTEMVLTKEDFEWAMNFLDEEEKTMHMALVLEGNNPVAKVSRLVNEYLYKNGPQLAIDLLEKFWEQVSKREDMEDALNYLIDTKQVRSVIKQAPGSDEKETYYEHIKAK